MSQDLQWTCPFCERESVVPASKLKWHADWMAIENARGPHRVAYRLVVCPNQACRQFAFTVFLHQAKQDGRGLWRVGSLVKRWDLVPPSKAKVYPEFVPKSILNDYREACLLLDLSPKASAALSRRCLQEMIRDYWGIKKDTLGQELDELRRRVDPLTWQAIEAVRNFGRIGTHTERDLGLIHDAEPEEAQKLIALIEVLIKDWYLTRQERLERLNALVTPGEARADQPYLTAAD